MQFGNRLRLVNKLVQASYTAGHLSAKHREVFRQVELFLKSHLHEQFQVSEMANVAGVSERTLERLFMSNLGMTPCAYLRVRRLHQARKELAEVSASNKSISQIALDQGFTHLGRFSMAYREFFGHSPSEFRTDKNLARTQSAHTSTFRPYLHRPSRSS